MNNLNILIVEDEKELSEFIKASFEADGHCVDVADDGELACDFAQKNKYDVIILDNVLPKKEGKQVCREIRSQGNHVPIIMLSVQSEIERKVDLLNNGADDYISKPFYFEELMARVKAVTRRSNKIIDEILQIGDLKLNVINKEVSFKNKTLNLTRKEFSILMCLMKNKREIVTRNNIMKYVWDENVDPFSNTLEAHIVQIRKKISKCGKKIYIHTITGVGYKISEEEF